MDAKEIVVGGDVLELKDAEARNLLGSETLDTEATTVTGAINELNSNLANKLTYMEMPYNSFVWDSSNLCFNLSKPNFGSLHIIGFLVTPTNGTAIMGAYLTANSQYLRVFGFIPKTGGSIDSDYQFKCYAIGY